MARGLSRAALLLGIGAGLAAGPAAADCAALAPLLADPAARVIPGSLAAGDRAWGPFLAGLAGADAFGGTDLDLDGDGRAERLTAWREDAAGCFLEWLDLGLRDGAPPDPALRAALLAAQGLPGELAAMPEDCHGGGQRRLLRAPDGLLGVALRGGRIAEARRLGGALLCREAP